MTEEGYAAPVTVEAAVSLLGEAGGGAKIMAGGTDILVQLHADLIDPDLIVDIKKIPDLRTIAEEAGGFRVGAAVTGMELMDHEAFAAAWPGVIDGVALIGSIQVKGRASVGGNLCNASPAADSVPPLIAAGAVAAIACPKGSRETPVEDIIVGPGETSLGPGEIITSFLFPPRQPHSGDCYLRLTPRTEMDIAIVGAGVNLTLDDDGVCVAARIALGAVAPTPILVAEAADCLIGTKIDNTALAGLAAAASAACDPIDDKRGTKIYRIKTAAVIARRATEKALERARGN
jgi:CO/xanthine dehydrogenase FAD-binding subunit